MKKILIVLLFIPIIALASLNLQKVSSTLANIKGHKEISFFNDNKDISLGDNINLTSSLDSADIILFSLEVYESKMTIVNSYKKLKSDKNSIGAIYVTKGRTQILFVKERLDANGLVLSSKLKKHLIHEWQLSPKSLVYNLK